jgi:hypothetical protein
MQHVRSAQEVAAIPLLQLAKQQLNNQALTTTVQLPEVV